MNGSTRMIGWVVVCAVLMLSATRPSVAADRPTGTSVAATNLHNTMKRLNATKQKPRTRYETGRQRIIHKLRTIHLPEIQFDGMTLEDVMDYLADEFQARDPEKKRINFMMVGPSATRTTTVPATTATVPGVVDPNGAALAPAVPAMPVQSLGMDLANVEIQLRQTLVGLNGLQILDVITKTADQPIRFSVNDYAIVAMPKGGPPLYMRSLQANPNTFRQGLQGVTATNPGFVGSGNGTSGAGNGN